MIKPNIRISFSLEEGMLHCDCVVELALSVINHDQSLMFGMIFTQKTFNPF